MLAREQNKDRFVIGSIEHVKKTIRIIAKETKFDEIMILNMITVKEHCINHIHY